MKRSIKRFGFKSLAVLLSTLMILYSVPTAVFAQIAELTEENAASESHPGFETVSEPFELVEKREESVKYFRDTDGSVLVAQYDLPVHYADENGDWQDINNSLEASGSDYVTGDNRIKFAKKITGNETLFALHNGNRKITMRLDGAIKKTTGQVTEYSTEEDDLTLLQKMMTLENLSSSILYAGILPGVDLEYVLQSGTVKENIIVKEKKDSYSYSFTLKLNNLDAVLTEQGEIEILDSDSGEVLYLIPAPIVFDAEDVYAPEEAANYSLVQTGNNEYRLAVTVDPAWMNADERVYPITVDPTIYKGGHNMQQIADTYVQSNNPTMISGSSTSLRAGYNGSGISRAYIALRTLPDLPTEAYITSAELTLMVKTTSTYSFTGTMYLAARTIELSSSSLWSESTMCWNTHTAQFDDLLDYQTFSSGVSYSDRDEYSWDITKAVREWYAGTKPNLGISIGLMDESDLSSVRYINFHSSESTLGGLTSYMPFFTFTYQDTKGLEDYYSYQSASAGLAGTAHVNLATGALSFTKPLLSTTDSLMPFTLSLTYNSVQSGNNYKYTNLNTAYTTGCVPYGFKFNVQETIIKKAYTNETNGTSYYYILADADGTEHYFHPIENQTNKYADEDGLQLVLDVSNSENLTISDDSKTVRTYKQVTPPSSEVPGAWVLNKITDKNGNAIEIAIGGATNDYRPLSISLRPSGSSNPINFLTIEYNSSNRPIVVYNQTAKEAIYFRYSSTVSGSISSTDTHYLKKLIYVHGTSGVSETDWVSHYNGATNSNITQDATVSYTYIYASRLSMAQDDRTGSGLRFTYSGTTDMVSKIEEYAGTANGQSCGIAYYSGYTDVQTSGSDDVYGTSDDLITRYTFDPKARAKSVYTTDLNGTQIHGAKSGEYETQEEVKNNLKSTTVVGGSATNYLLNGGFEWWNGTNFAVWNATNNVKKIESEPGENIHGNYYEAQFNVKAGVTDSLRQNTTLSSGEYTLSAQLLTRYCKGVTITLRAESLSNSSHTSEKIISVNEYNADDDEVKLTASLNLTGSSNEQFRIWIIVTGGSTVDANAVVRVDNVVLEKGKGVGKYSLVQNGHFEYQANSSNASSAAVPGWQGNYTTVSTDAPFGKAAKLTSTSPGHLAFGQKIYEVSPLSDEDAYSAKTFIVSGFAKAEGQVASDIGSFEIYADIWYEDPVYIERCETVSFAFESSCNDWQFVNGSFTTKAGQLVLKIEIYASFTNQPAGAMAWFDDISVVANNDDSVVAYQYYSTGKTSGLTSVKTSGYYTEYYYYDDDRRLTRVENSRGEITEYSYDFSNGNLIEEAYYSTPQIAKMITQYEYNDYGQVTLVDTCEAKTESVLVQGENGKEYFYYAVPNANSKHLTTSMTYETTAGSHIFGALLTETDSLNRTTKYYYNQTNGRMFASINISAKYGTCYSYDAIGNLIMVRPVSYDTYTGTFWVSGNEKVNYTYDDDTQLLEQISTASTIYNFVYTPFGGTDSISVGSQELASYEYNANNGKLKKIHYGNGFVVDYVYDALDNIKEIWYTENGTRTQAYEYTYTKYGQLAQFDNLLTGKSTVYAYDSSGNLVEFVEYDDSDHVIDFSTRLQYDTEGRLANTHTSIPYRSNNDWYEYELPYTYEYNPDDSSLKEYEFGSGNAYGTITYSYDKYQRLSTKTRQNVGFNNTVSYTFTETGNNTSAQVETYTSTVNGTSNTYTYSYDNRGNITRIVDNTTTWIYEYDDLSQLLSETIYKTSTTVGKKYIYTYDDAGNILTKETYDYNAGMLTNGTTINYTYGNANWGDQLTAYDGHQITYDAIGNPLSYYNGSSYTFEWINGRQLSEATIGRNHFAFEYNDEGIRTKKIINGTEHNYYLSGSQILAQEWSTTATTYLFIFLYDAEGSPIGMQCRVSNMDEDEFYIFWFEKNLQGDIIAIYNASGTKVLSYTYDAWGKVTQTWHDNSGYNTYAQYNPFRYRGYYYDTTLNLYYLNSRYYDPAVGRFINADSYVSTGQDLLGSNMFAYCGNNPVIRIDALGVFWERIPDLIETASDILSEITEHAAKTAIKTASTLTSTSISGGGVYVFLPNKLAEHSAVHSNNLTNISTGAKILGKIAGGISLGIAIIDVSIKIYNNFTDDNMSLSRKLTDSWVDLLVTTYSVLIPIAANVAVTAILPIPGLGSAAGLVASFAVDLVVNNTPLVGWYKDAWGWIGNKVEGWLGGLFDEETEAIA